MTTGTRIKIDISDLEKDLRGIVYKQINELIQEMNIRELIDKRVNKEIKNSIDKKIESKVYSYLEEARIELPSKTVYNNRKIFLNDYIIQIVNERVSDIVFNTLKEKITIEVKTVE